jgi:mannose-6-phosphate isomerase-like protein (cupin superfamily)
MPNSESKELFYFDVAVDKHSTAQSTRHYHNSFEVYYLKVGHCNYFIDNRSYDMKVGDIVLIPKG